MFRRHSNIKLLSGFVVGIVLLYLIISWYKSSQARQAIDASAPCNVSLGPHLEKDLAKIQSYSFPSAEKYLADLFPKPTIEDGKMPSIPAIVTAFSSSHMMEGLALIENVNRVVRANYKDIKFFIFNIGLSKADHDKIVNVCQCEVKKFPFDQLPEHFKIMKGYAWKPLVIQMVAKDYPFVIWTDTSVRFMSSNLDFLFTKARDLGVMAAIGYGPVASRTVLKTFEYLQEQPCTFLGNEFEATFIVIYGNSFVRKNFLRPWVSCALTLGCLVPDMSPHKYIDCTSSEPVYFYCHRFDQSILSILLYRIYHDNIQHHGMKHDFFQFCKGGDELWYLPQFINELIVKYQNNCF